MACGMSCGEERRGLRRRGRQWFVCEGGGHGDTYKVGGDEGFGRSKAAAAKARRAQTAALLDLKLHEQRTSAARMAKSACKVSCADRRATCDCAATLHTEDAALVW